MKKFLQTLKMAVNALRRNVMRSALTTLGIIIGIGSVIAMVEIGEGSSQSLQQSIKSMGADNLMIQPGTAASGGISMGGGTIKTLTPTDAEAIARECTAVKAVAPVVQSRTQVVYGNRNWVPFQIVGTTPDYLAIRDWQQMGSGDPFTDLDVRNANRVCLLGQTLVNELFRGEPPIGKAIRIQNVPFKVIGVLGRKGANMMGMDQDDVVLAPWTTIKYRVSGNSVTQTNQSAEASSSETSTSSLYSRTSADLYPERSSTQQRNTPQPVRFINVDTLSVRANSTAEIPLAMRQMTAVLRDRHRIKPGDADDFSIQDMTEMTRTLGGASALMTRLLLFVAAISLMVGGVGIMNIMLVSVTERTREIGLRMAVGASDADILSQFITEAVVLCLLGGIMGILLGRSLSALVGLVLGWPVGISVPAIAAAVLVSATVGVAFGFYPAYKASRLDPIEALRYE